MAVKKLSLLNVDKRLREQEELIADMQKKIALMEEIIQLFSKELEKKKPKPSTINKIETYNNDKEPAVAEERSIKMDEAAKVVSISNACKILPPNLVVDGRHLKENVSAVCGFRVSEEQLDQAYAMLGE